MSNSKLKTIDDYIHTFPEEVRERLENVRQTIRKAVPEAQEALKWSRPAFVGETILVMFGGFKNHIGFYTTPSSLEVFEDELSDYKTGKGSVQFPHNEPLPTELITKMTEYRDWELREKGVNWM